MTAKKRLIINADDFGQSPGINRGTIEAHEFGIVTSASLMVRWPAASEAVAYCKQRPDLSLGLHLDLGEWAFRENKWTPLYEVISSNDVSEISREVIRQLEMFRRLTGKDPTHIDSHQHVHLEKPAFKITNEMAERLGVPLRNCSAAIQYCGGFYGQTDDGLPNHECLSAAGLIGIIKALAPGVTELSCHPGRDTDIDTMYRNERDKEVDVLCDPRVRAAINDLDIELVSFSNYCQAELAIASV